MTPRLKILCVAALLLASMVQPVRVVETTTVIGRLDWARNSVCEWPPGTFLRDYVQDGCGEMWLARGPFPTGGEWAGWGIHATGHIVVNGSCTILEVSSYTVCPPPPPDMPDG